MSHVTLHQLHKDMCRSGVSCRVDESTAGGNSVKSAHQKFTMNNNYRSDFWEILSAIGRRYSRIDEIGVPLVVTVDFDTAVNGGVTVRDRDSCEQIRVPLTAVVQLVGDMTHGLSRVSWEEAKTRFPRFHAGNSAEGE